MLKRDCIGGRMLEEKKRILVVDDDPDILVVVAAVLQFHGYEVITARDGEEALARLKERRPDLMLLDLLMPGMDGFSVLKELKGPQWTEYSDVPIVILSSVRAEVGQRRYELETMSRLDVDDYLEKPVEPHVLVEAVQRLLEQRA